MDLKSYRQVLVAENNIVERGTLTWESLVSICEYRPWIFKALAEYLGLELGDLKTYVETHVISGWAYFYILTRYRLQAEPRVSFFHGDVLYE